MISINDHRTATGDIDWQALRKAEVAGGHACMTCGDFMWARGGPVECAQCMRIHDGKPEISHTKFVVCPSCRHRSDPFDHDQYELLSDDRSHRVTCEKCDKEFVVETMVKYTFTSRPARDSD